MKEVKELSIFVSDSIGKISAVVDRPENAESILVLAHGAGAGMNHPFMSALSRELASRSVATLRYNFPYMEKKQNRPDPPAIAWKAVEAAIEKAHSIFGELPLFAGGKSFGGRMTSQRMAKEGPPVVNGIVFYGFPLHPLGTPSIERGAHLAEVKVPMLFLQGSRDKMAELPLLEKVCQRLPLATLSLFDGADHSFKSGKKDLIPELAERTKVWMKDVLS